MLPNLAAQLIKSASSRNENADSDCSTALQLLWLYGEDRLLRLVLPALAAWEDSSMAGDDFVSVCVPALLDLAGRDCGAAARLYRDLRRVLSALPLPDLVRQVTEAEWRIYGEHNAAGKVSKVRPQYSPRGRI